MVQRGKIGFGGSGPKSGAKRLLKNEGKEMYFDPSEYLFLSNVGIQGGILFSSQEDYDRFEAYLYLLNAIEGPRASNFFLDGRNHDIFTVARGETLVAIGAYSFTPKQFSIVVKSLAPNGISKFMQKLQTAYTMYFNGKYQRSGRIFHSGYRSHAAQSETELKYFLAATHMQPAVLFNAHWEDADDQELQVLAYRAAEYRYSSFGEYTKRKFNILAPQYFPNFFSGSKNPSVLASQWKRARSILERAYKNKK